MQQQVSGKLSQVRPHLDLMLGRRGVRVIMLNTMIEEMQTEVKFEAVINQASRTANLLLSLPFGFREKSRGNGRCLDNEAQPALGLDFQSVSRLPGEQYSPDLQCQLALGTQYKAYYSAKQPFNV